MGHSTSRRSSQNLSCIVPEPIIDPRDQRTPTSSSSRRSSFNDGQSSQPDPASVYRSMNLTDIYRSPSRSSLGCRNTPPPYSAIPCASSIPRSSYHAEEASVKPYSYDITVGSVGRQDAISGYTYNLVKNDIPQVTVTPDLPQRPRRGNSVEDVLELLRKYRTVFVVDDSRSMYGPLWRETRDALSALAQESARYALDGIDVHFLNDEREGLSLNSAAVVKHLFDSVTPRGPTPIGEKLERLLLEYLGGLEQAKDKAEAGDVTALKSYKPVNFIVLTDGAPTDDPESAIVAAAKRLDARNFPLNQVGIQFVQIGDSPEAAEFLRQLDDGLASTYGIRDMVDTTPYTGQLNAEVLTKILLGGVNRRVDKRGAADMLA